MLVLRRVPGQHLVIAGDIRITVLKVSGRHVTFGIEAPREVSILRGELRPFEEDQRTPSPSGVPTPPSEAKDSFPS